MRWQTPNIKQISEEMSDVFLSVHAFSSKASRSAASLVCTSSWKWKYGLQCLKSKQTYFFAMLQCSFAVKKLHEAK